MCKNTFKKLVRVIVLTLIITSFIIFYIRTIMFQTIVSNRVETNTFICDSTSDNKKYLQRYIIMCMLSTIDMFIYITLYIELFVILIMDYNLETIREFTTHTCYINFFKALNKFDTIIFFKRIIIAPLIFYTHSSCTSIPKNINVNCTANLLYNMLLFLLLIITWVYSCS